MCGQIMHNLDSNAFYFYFKTKIVQHFSWMFIILMRKMCKCIPFLGKTVEMELLQCFCLQISCVWREVFVGNIVVKMFMKIAS